MLEKKLAGIENFEHDFYRYGRSRFWQGFFLGVGIISCAVSVAYYFDKAYNLGLTKKSQTHYENSVENKGEKLK